MMLQPPPTQSAQTMTPQIRQSHTLTFLKFLDFIPMVNVPLVPGGAGRPTCPNIPFKSEEYTCTYCWVRHMQPAHDVRVGNGPIYIPTIMDEDFELSVRCNLYYNGQWVAGNHIFTKPVINVPDVELFTVRRHMDSSIDKSGDPQMMVLTYNVLAHEFATKVIQWSKKLFLNWTFRFQNISLEIKEMNPDIICFQEVEEEHFKHYMEGKVPGYTFTYMMKDEKGTPTGNATAYKNVKISSVVNYKLDLEKLSKILSITSPLISFAV